MCLCIGRCSRQCAIQEAVQGSDMPPSDSSAAVPGLTPGQGPVRDTLSRIRRTYNGSPLPVKALIVVVCCILVFPVAIALAPYAVFATSRAPWATASVGMGAMPLE